MAEGEEILDQSNDEHETKAVKIYCVMYWSWTQTFLLEMCKTDASTRKQVYKI